MSLLRLIRSSLTYLTEHLVHKVRLARLGFKVRRERMGFKVRREYQERMEILGKKAIPDLRGLPE
jgi:hypothetical protein